MRHNKIFRFLLSTAILLLSCQLFSLNSPVEIRQSATTASSKPNTYVDAEYGVTLTYPRGWRTATDPDALVAFVSPDGSVYIYLYTIPASSDLTLELLSTQIRDDLSSLSDLTYLEDSSTELTDGKSAWVIEATAANADNTRIKIGFSFSIFGSYAYIMQAVATINAYDYYTEDISALFSAMHLEIPETYETYGIPRDQGLFLASGESTNPRDYDPATTHSGGDKLVFSGLVSFDPHLSLRAELAETWEISSDGTIYTFHLRTDAHFHDGRPVTAQDFVYSWQRAADPTTQSDTVLTYLGDIVGVAEMHNGQAQHISGLQALDDHILQVTIDEPKPYFLMKLTYPTAFVVDRENVESGSEWYRTPNGSGPYKLIRWDRFKVMIYERNQEFYFGQPPIKYIVVNLFAGVDIRLYESGQIDKASVSSYDVPRVLDPNEPLHSDLYSGVDLCTDYIVFDVTQPPFDDVLVRKAFSKAFNRQQYIDVIYSGVGIPAKGLYPPGLPGYSLLLQGLSFDPENARQLLTQSRYGGLQGLPPIVFTTAGIGSAPSLDAAAMVQMWEQNLGVEITIENLEPNQYYDLLHSGHHSQIFEGGWCADYPDPENFADVLFHTDAQQNLGNYSNQELDTILDQARIEQDVSERIKLYQQAEQIIVQDAPALFIMHSLSYVLIKPYIQGFILTPIDVPLERYLWLER